MPKFKLQSPYGVALLGLVAVGLWQVAPDPFGGRDAGAQSAPSFQVDPFWPKPLPNNWILGQVAGIAVDSQDHVWLIQRPGSLTEDERGAAPTPAPEEGTGAGALPRSDCCVPAPPVMEFDAEGNFIQGWGGPGEGYDWPENEHGIFVDANDNVWLTGNGDFDHQVLKFSRDGTFLLQIGKAGQTGGNDDKELLGRPADMYVDTEANEVYVADGYRNHRIIVFDAETGEFKRYWGAYGREPADVEQRADFPYNPEEEPAQFFRNPVHCVVIAEDGLVYVCDRVNNRMQVFQKDGTFVKEFFLARNTLGNGAVWDLDFSPDEQDTYMYNADGENNHIWVLLRDSGDILSNFGRHGRYAGQFHWVHNVAVDSQGNLYTAEVDTGKRAQKFVPQGGQQGQQ